MKLIRRKERIIDFLKAKGRVFRQGRLARVECRHPEVETSLAYPRERQEASVPGGRVIGDEVGLAGRS